jgi:hypothetical protein
MTSLVSKQVSYLEQSYSKNLCDKAASFFTDKSKSIFDKLQPPDKDSTSLYSTIITDKILSKFSYESHDVITYLGYILVLEKFLVDAISDKEILDSLMDDIVTKLHPGGEVHKVSVKRIGRVVEKLLIQCNGNFRALCDLARGSLVYEDIDKLRQVINSFGSSLGTVSHKHVVKDRFKRPLETGYMDINCSIGLRGSNHVVELQLHIREIFCANKDGVGKSNDELQDIRYIFNDEEKEEVLNFTKTNSQLKTDKQLGIFFDDLLNSAFVQIRPHYLYQFIRSTSNSKSSIAIKRMRSVCVDLSKSIFGEAYDNYKQRIARSLV